MFYVIYVIYYFITGWIEPLLDRIADNKSNVVCPTIDNILDDTLKYAVSPHTNIVPS